MKYGLFPNFGRVLGMGRKARGPMYLYTRKTSLRFRGPHAGTARSVPLPASQVTWLRKVYVGFRVWETW